MESPEGVEKGAQTVLHPSRETVKKVNKEEVNPRGELRHESRTQEIHARIQSECCTAI